MASTLDSINRELGRCLPIYGCERYGAGDEQWEWSDEIKVGVVHEFHIRVEENRMYVRIGARG